MGRSLALALFLILSATAFFPCRAGDAPTAIALVDVQNLLQTAAAEKDIQRQLDAQRERFQAETTAEEKDLREVERKLAALRESGKADAYAEEEQKLRQRFLRVERQVQSRRKALDQAMTDSTSTVRSGLVSCSERIAKERGFSLVLVKQQVIWSGPSIDITKDVLACLDKALPNIPVIVKPEAEADHGRAATAAERPMKRQQKPEKKR